MSDLSLSDGDGLDAGLAAGFGAGPEPVLAAIERSTGTLVPRVVLRAAAPDLGAPVTRGGAPTPGLAPHGRASYQLHGEIARGGMGVLFKGRDVDLGRDVALKVLRDDLAHRPEIVQRFVEEAQIGGQLQHPGIVPVYELGLMSDQRPYFAMKLVQGRTLAALLAERGAHARRELLDVFASVCQTLAYAHSRGVVHRDLKPANVLIGAFGEVQVIDWGLAKVLGFGGVADEQRARDARATPGTASPATAKIATVRTGSASKGSHSIAGSVMGTPAYMAPEQARGEVGRIDERTDVFALGAILCEILTGDPPYRGEAQRTMLQAANADLNDARQRLTTCDGDREVVELCLECLAVAPEARPPSARALAKRVQAYLASLEERARRAEVRAAEERLRARSTVTLTAIAALVLLAGAAVWLVWREDRARQVREAERSVGSAVAEATLARGRRDWAAASLALGRAAARIEGSPASDALREQVAALGALIEGEARDARASEELTRDNAAWLAQLADVRQPEGDSVYPTDWRALDRTYAALFAARGAHLDVGEIEASVRDLRARGISLELAWALDEWSSVRRRALDEAGAARLTRVADGLDPDPLRSELRAALAANDSTRLRAAAERGRSEALPPPTLCLLAHEFRSGPELELALELLGAGRLRHPQDYGLALEFARALRRCDPPRPVDALAHYQVAVALRPQSVEGWHELAMTLDPLLGRPKEALATLRDALERFPDDGHLHFHVGSALAALGRDGEAIESLEQALALEGPSALTYCNLGVCLDRLGRTEEAIERYERSIALDPRVVDTHHDLGVSLRKLGRYDEAILEFERALELDTGNWRSYTELAYVHLTRGAYDDAIDAAQRATELAPTFPSNPFYLGRALDESGRSVEARAAYEGCLARTPDFVPAQRSLVLLLVGAEREDVHDPQAALPHARRLVERSPGDADLLSITLYAAGEFDQARRAFEVASTPEVDDPGRALFLGLCDLHLGRVGEARERLGAVDLDALAESMPLVRRFVGEARTFLAAR